MEEEEKGKEVECLATLCAVGRSKAGLYLLEWGE